MVHGETGCQLYLILPPEKDRDAALRFVEAGGLGHFASVLLQSRNDGKVDRSFAETLLRHAHDANIPLLLEDDISAVTGLGTDGVHIRADEDIYSEARSALGDGAIIGVECGLSRHTGLAFAELGAEYIAFSERDAATPGEKLEVFEDLIAWWAETVTVPSVAWDISTMETAHRLAVAGADFVALGGPLWSHANGPAAAADELSASLAEHRVSA